MPIHTTTEAYIFLFLVGIIYVSVVLLVLFFITVTIQKLNGNNQIITDLIAERDEAKSEVKQERKLSSDKTTIVKGFTQELNKKLDELKQLSGQTEHASKLDAFINKN